MADEPRDWTDINKLMHLSRVETPGFEEWAAGLKPIGEPFTISGMWDPDPRPICPFCKLRFTPLENMPLPMATATVDGEEVCLGLVCEACAVQQLID